MGKFSDELILETVAKSRYFNEFARNLGASGRGGSYTTLRRRLDSLNADRSHWLTKKEVSAIANSKPGKKLTLNETFVVSENKTRTKTHLLRRALLEAEVPYCCNECGLMEWNGEPIDLEVDHINEIPYDNRFENLQFLCSNCHTFKTRTKKKKLRQEQKAKMATERKQKEKKCWVCNGCGKTTSKGNTRCLQCSGIDNRKIEWPPIDELRERLSCSNYSALARELGVSDNAIRKHISRGSSKTENTG